MKTKQKSLIVEQDDLSIHEHYMAHSWKFDTHKPIPIGGMAFELTAMQRPFVIGKLVCDEEHPAITIDLRSVNLMKASPEYVKAQTPETRKARNRKNGV